MKFHSFLIKYGEIGIKGKNRYIFEDALVRQIRYALQEQTENFWFISAMEEFMWTVRENTILRKR